MSCLDLSFHIVSENLEASSSRAELLGSTASQEGITSARGVWTWTLEGKKLILYCSSACYIALGGLYIQS